MLKRFNKVLEENIAIQTLVTIVGVILITPILLLSVGWLEGKTAGQQFSEIAISMDGDWGQFLLFIAFMIIIVYFILMNIERNWNKKETK